MQGFQNFYSLAKTAKAREVPKTNIMIKNNKQDYLVKSNMRNENLNAVKEEPGMGVER